MKTKIKQIAFYAIVFTTVYTIGFIIATHFNIVNFITNLLK